MEADDPCLPLKIVQAVSVEAFDPPIFAALCSPNLNIALQRISRCKRLIMPMALHIKETVSSTSLELEWLDATMSERVRAALLELLPSGSTTIDSAAEKLRVSTRTLQRRLKEEGDSFQSALNGTREKLALHYLKNPALSGAEISFLLGYEEPGSFFRAFHNWTGKTPQSARTAMQSNH